MKAYTQVKQAKIAELFHLIVLRAVWQGLETVLARELANPPRAGFLKGARAKSDQHEDQDEEHSLVAHDVVAQCANAPILGGFKLK